MGKINPHIANVETKVKPQLRLENEQDHAQDHTECNDPTHDDQHFIAVHDTPLNQRTEKSIFTSTKPAWQEPRNKKSVNRT